MVKTVIPEMTLHFDSDMIVLEKWDPKKPLTAIYWEGSKELYYVKRFLIENPDKEESIIGDHSDSQLECIFTDYRPQAEVVFAKKRGKDRKENLVIDLEEFIAVKGISAMGNQLTKDKVLEINAMEPLPYEAPEALPAEDMEVVDEQDVSPAQQAEDDSKATDTAAEDAKDDSGEEGQTTLF
jgi:topoisomerase-4 subunit A